MAEDSHSSMDSGNLFCCKICMEKYNDPDRLPKLLDCGHTCCLACLKQWAGKKKKGFITCPTCNKECMLLKGGVDKLKTNFEIMEEAQKYKEAVRQSQIKKSASAKDVGNAQQGGGAGAAGTSQHEIQHLLSTLPAHVRDVNKSGEVFDATIHKIRGERHDVTKKRDDTKETINRDYTKLVKSATERKKKLLEEVNKCCEENLTLLTAYEDEYNKHKEEHSNFCRELLEGYLTQQQSAKPSQEASDRLCQSAQSRSLSLNHEFQFISKRLSYTDDSCGGILEDINSWGNVTQISAVLTVPPTCPVQKASPATTDTHSDALSRYLSKSRVVRTYGACSPCCVTQLSNEEIAVANANTYDISIFSSAQIERSLLRLKVSKAVTFNQGITGMCVDPRGTLLISHPDHNEIQNWDLLGNLVHLIRVSNKEEFDPAGVACSPRGHLYVCDRKNHLVRVFELNKNWEEIDKFGKRGKDPGSFNNPSDVALMPDGEIAVADFKNDRIQIFDGETLVYKRTIATSGSKLGQLRGPSGIAVDSDGFMAVSEPMNHRVQLFTPGGKPFATLGAAEEGPDYLTWPSGIAITMANEVVVCDRGNDVVRVY